VEHVHTRPVALLGDAMHTAHFSVGSGTKMAMEDAVALAAALAEHPGDLAGALAAYEVRRPAVGAGHPGIGRAVTELVEHFGRYHDAFEPWQFGYHFLSAPSPTPGSPAATRSSSPRPTTAAAPARSRAAAQRAGGGRRDA